MYVYGGVGRDIRFTVDTNGDGNLGDETFSDVPGSGQLFTIDGALTAGAPFDPAA